MKTAVIIGSTGLIGSLLIKKLVQEGSFTQIIAIVRRKPTDEAVFDNPRVRVLTFDFKNWGDLEMQVSSFSGTSSSNFFCCLGTTISQAGSESAFKTVDFEHVVNFARLAKSCRAQQLLVVSALGASKNSNVFYNRTKGEMEEAVEKVFAGKLHFLRPSLLLGDRADFRFGERLAILLEPVYSPLLIGSLKKYRPVKASRVAEVMVLLSTGKLDGPKILENSEL